MKITAYMTFEVFEITIPFGNGIVYSPTLFSLFVVGEDNIVILPDLIPDGCDSAAEVGIDILKDINIKVVNNIF
jgi:hypothetical protein